MGASLPVGNNGKGRGDAPEAPGSPMNHMGSMDSLQGPASTEREQQLLDEETRERKLKVERWQPMDFLLGTPIGQGLVLLIAMAILLFAGAGVWMCTDGFPELYDNSFIQSLWFSYGMIFDPGTQMGFPSDSPKRLRLIAATMSTVGFMYMLLIVGIIVEFCRVSLESLRKIRNRLVINGHCLVLGWSDKTLFLLREMSAAFRNRGINAQIVVLADVDEMVMSNEIHRHFPKAGQRRRFVCRRGIPYEIDDLWKASAVSARDVVILGSEAGRARDSDLQVVKAVVALAALPEQPSGNIISEVRMPETAPVIRAIQDRADGIIARDPVFRVLSLMAVQPVIGDVFVQLFSFVRGEELYIKSRNELSPEVANCTTFGEACRALKLGICVGVKQPDQPALLAPLDNFVIRPNDRLVVLAGSENDLVERRGLAGFLRSATDDSMDPTQFEGGGRLSRGATPRAEGACAHKLIIIGWPNDMVDLLLILDDYTPVGTEVHILCEKSIDEQKRAIEGAPSVTKHLKIHHYRGHMTSVRKLAKMPLADAFSVLVLANETDVENASESDAACLACAVTLNQLCEGRHPHYADIHSDARIICEVLAPRTARVLGRGGQLRKTATFFQSSALETGVFAMASAEQAVFNTLMLLIKKNMLGDIAVEPIEQYVSEADLTEKKLTFWGLWDRVRRREDVLIGWKLEQSDTTELNPPKTETVPLTRGDKLVILRNRNFAMVMEQANAAAVHQHSLL